MQDRRQVPRYLFNGPAELSQSPGRPALKVALLRISIQGCFAEGPGIPPVGQKCEVSFEWEGKQFRNQAEVIWRKPNGEAGLRFLSLEQRNLETLRELCAGLRLEPLVPRRPEKD